MDKNRLLYGNFLFDAGRKGPPSAGVIKGAGQTSILFGFIGSGRDSLVYSYDTDREYFDYLSYHGIEFPGLIKPGGRVAPGTEGAAWGWSEESVKLLEDSGAVCTCPALDTVRRVNSKKFCLNVSLKNKIGPPLSEFCENITEVENHIENVRHGPYVIKPEHGNSGAGFIIKKEGGLTREELDRLEGGAGPQSGGYIVQPWFEREADISSQCFISKNGAAGPVSHHRTLINRSGTFYANFFSDNDVLIEKHRNRLDRMVHAAAGALAAEGYFGPAGFDSFVCAEESDRLFLIEINARFTMGIIAQSIIDRLETGGSFLFRFISKRRHRLPGSYEELLKILGECSFRGERGAVLLTPLSVRGPKGEIDQPQRSAFLVCGGSIEDIESIDTDLRRKLRR